MYSYNDAVFDDIVSFVNKKFTEEEKCSIFYSSDAHDLLYNILKNEDGVTGASRGSYTMDRSIAKSNLKGNEEMLYDAVLGVCADMVECPNAYICRSPEEFCDALIRCYLLPDMLDDVIRQYREGTDTPAEPLNDDEAKNCGMETFSW